MNLPLAASSWQRPGLFFSSALPAVRVPFPARLFCQGRPLRSPERTLRGLDSASRKAPETARKGICFIFFQAEIALEKRRETNTTGRRENLSYSGTGRKGDCRAAKLRAGKLP